MAKRNEVGRNRKYPWDKIDPQIFGGKVSLKSLSIDYHVPYRQVTNRKYNLRDKVQKLANDKRDKELSKMLRYLKVKDISKIPMLNS
jgi:hypothetical protein